MKTFEIRTKQTIYRRYWVEARHREEAEARWRNTYDWEADPKKKNTTSKEAILGTEEITP